MRTVIVSRHASILLLRVLLENNIAFVDVTHERDIPKTFDPEQYRLKKLPPVKPGPWYRQYEKRNRK